MAADHEHVLSDHHPGIINKGVVCIRVCGLEYTNKMARLAIWLLAESRRMIPVKLKKLFSLVETQSYATFLQPTTHLFVL